MPAEEIPESLEEFISNIADGTGFETGQVITYLDTQYGLDVTEVSEEDADKFVEAFDAGDEETVREILEEYDAGEENIEKFLGEMEFVQDTRDTIEQTPSPDTDTNGKEAPTTQKADSGDGMSREEVRQMIRQETPSASQIASEIRSDMEQQSGGQGQGDDGLSMQQQTALQLISQHLGNSGGGQMAELGQQFQKAAMNSYLKKLQKPTLGEIMEMKMYDKLADEYADEYAEELFDGDPLEELEEVDDDADDESGWGLW